MGGMFGVTTQSDCVKDLFYGTDYHSHLGTKRGGMAVNGSSGFKRSIHNIENNYFRTKFEGDLTKFQGRQGIGVISDYDPQPLIISSHLGTFGIVTVGKINNLEDLVRKALSRKKYFSENLGGETNPTELVAMLVCEEASYEAGIQNAQAQIEGSCSLMLLTEKGIYAARDKLGRTPLVIGKREDGWAVASESCAFPNLGFQVDTFLGPGETGLLTPDGFEQVVAPGERMQVCSFLWVYYGYPASEYEGINVEYVRNNCGAALARRDDTEIDYVAGIPDSGIGHAIGYAGEKKVPYFRPFVKYTPTWPRSFMPQDQNLREYGALEAHMRPACPTLIFPCEFLNFSTSRSTLDLAGRQVIKALEGVEDKDLDAYARSGSAKNLAMIDRIRARLKLTSLKYQHLEDLVASIGLPKERLCTHCWDGSSYF